MQQALRGSITLGTPQVLRPCTSPNEDLDGKKAATSQIPCIPVHPRELQ